MLWVWPTCPAGDHVGTSGHELAVFSVELGELRSILLCKGIHELRVGSLNLINESCGVESCSQYNADLRVLPRPSRNSVCYILFQWLRLTAGIVKLN